MAYFAASIDNPERNRKFAKMLGLDFPLLSDSDKRVARSYGVLRGLGLYTARHTFYIDATGHIAFIDRKVQPASAGHDLVARLAELGIARRET